MPNQQPHHVSRLAFRISCLFRISSFGFRISPDPSGRIMRNEPNLPAHRPKSAKRTQFPHTKGPPTPNFCETNPISTPQKNETNPIPTYRCCLAGFSSPKYAKRTQFTVPPAFPPTQKNETNPISGPPPPRRPYIPRQNILGISDNRGREKNKRVS